MFIDLNDENFQKEIGSGLKLVNFYTTWCKFCQKQDEVLDELNDNGFWIGKLDCDKYTKIAKDNGISGYPSFVLFKNGKKAAQFAGYHTKSQLLNKLTSYI